MKNKVILTLITLIVALSSQAATKQVAFGKGTLTWKFVAGNAVRFHYAEGQEEKLPEWLYVAEETAEPAGIEVVVNKDSQQVEVKDRNGRTVFTAT